MHTTIRLIKIITYSLSSFLALCCLGEGEVIGLARLSLLGETGAFLVSGNAVLELLYFIY